MDWIDGEPPPPRHWVKEAIRELKKRPGHWAMVQKYYNAYSVQYGQRRLRQLGCEARSVYVNNTWELYARWPE
jgi:hypothetical protein